MSSTIAIAGCVSLSCTATLAAKLSQEFPLVRRCRRMMSRNEQATKKYCCTSRSSLPFSVLSFG